MADDKPTHLPAEGEGTPAMPVESDLAPSAKTSDEDKVPPFPDPQIGIAVDQG